jgi:phosphoribosylformylglycinamidine cyclo-ligase
MKPSLEGSGIDLSRQDDASAVAFEWARRTFVNRRGRTGDPTLGAAGFFANLMDFGGISVAMTSDGIGTKVEVAERTGIYDTLGFDLMAMVVDDLAAVGCEPVNVSNILDVDILDTAVVGDLMRGLHDAARVARVAVTGGEIAELGSRVSGWGAGMHFNWCATAVGVLSPGLAPLDGTTVAPGHAVVALRSEGLRSNGFSLARRILESQFGDHWHEVAVGDTTWGRALLTPSRIYAPLIVDLLTGGCPLSGAVHVTGGGVPGNLSRLLRACRVGARLDSLFPPEPFVGEMAAMGGVPAEQAMRLWNMGNGMLLTMPPEAASRCTTEAARRGYPARVAGEVTAAPGITIVVEGAGEVVFRDEPQ